MARPYPIREYKNEARSVAQPDPEERMKGLEPSTFAMARRRSSQLSYIRESATFYPLNVERPTSPKGSSRARTACWNPSCAAMRANS